MKLNKYILAPGIALALGLTVASCNNDDFTETIFPEVSDEADPESTTYKFDTWLNQNFRDVYNLEFKYKLSDVNTDYDYNLTPASLDAAMKMAVLIKYMWYDAYAEAYGGSKDKLDPGFLRAVGPKMIHLIGSPMYNTNGSVTLGYASGGVQITLCDINAANFNSAQALNNQYFHTMHHEYCHILAQTKNYPTEFNLLSNGRYDSSNWQDRNGGIVVSLGFQTPYASSENNEDWAETVSGYLTRNDADWELLYWCADRGWDTDSEDELDQSKAYCYYFYKNEAARAEDKKTFTLRFASDAFGNNLRVISSEGNAYTSPEAIQNYIDNTDLRLRNSFKDTTAQERYGTKYAQCTDDQQAVIDAIADTMTFMYPVEDKDQVDGRAIMEQKINIARNWFRDSWGMDLDALRSIVQRRSLDFNLDDLLSEIENIPAPAAAK